MARLIIKIHDDKLNKDWYLEWSSIVDAPVTYGLELDEFKKYYKEEYGREGMSELQDRLDRVEKTGCSSRHGSTLDDILASNRAGEKEECLTKEQMLDKFCRGILALKKSSKK